MCFKAELLEVHFVVERYYLCEYYLDDSWYGLVSIHPYGHTDTFVFLKIHVQYESGEYICKIKS